MRHEVVLTEAQFEPKLVGYWSFLSLIGLTCTIIGIPLLPFLLILGPPFFNRRLAALHCQLTERSLHIKRGVIFRSEKNIPLDKIQDVGMVEGPLLRKLGLVQLSIETAGQSSAQGAADASLVGIIDARAFRDAILEQRDRVVGAAPASASEPQDRAGSNSSHDVLVEISASLGRIESLLKSSE